MSLSSGFNCSISPSSFTSRLLEQNYFYLNFRAVFCWLLTSAPILVVPFLLSAVVTGSMKIHPREVLLTHSSLWRVEIKTHVEIKSAQG